MTTYLTLLFNILLNRCVKIKLLYDLTAHGLAHMADTHIGESDMMFLRKKWVCFDLKIWSVMRAPLLREYSHCFHYCVGFKNSHAIEIKLHLKIDSSLWVRFEYIFIVIYTIRLPGRYLIYSDDDREVGLLQIESAACVFVCVCLRAVAITTEKLQKHYICWKRH